MAFDESLAGRVRSLLARRRGVEEKRLFGCVCFLLRGHVCVGVWKDSLIARLGADQTEAAMREPHVQAFDITGRAMKGWVVVGPQGVADEDQLSEWARLAVEFVDKLPAK
jgi:hypothetical protein